jgi:hypothetical protein
MTISEFSERLFEQTNGFIAGQTQLKGFDRKLSGKGTKSANFFRAQKSRGLLIYIAATARYSANDAITLKILKCPGDRVGVDSQLNSQLAYGWERIVVAQGSGGYSVTHLVFDLEVNWDAGSGMDAKQHLSICTNTLIRMTDLSRAFSKMHAAQITRSFVGWIYATRN